LKKLQKEVKDKTNEANKYQMQVGLKDTQLGIMNDRVKKSFDSMIKLINDDERSKEEKVRELERLKKNTL